MAKIVIIGNGISGVTAARHIRKRDSEAEITIISAETDYFFSRTALMYIYMGHMQFKDTQPYEPWFWKKNRIDLVRAYVTHVDFEHKKLSLDNLPDLSYDKLILAVGSRPNKLGWKGQDLPGVQGLYSYQDVELLEKNSKGLKEAVIVGGGLIGVELAEMLITRGVNVTFVVRDKRFWNSVLPDQEAELITKHIRSHHVNLMLEDELEEILEGSNGRVAGIKTKSGKKIDCQLVGLTVGVSPNVDFLKNTSLEIEKGIMVNRYLETNQDDVYAIGDCAQFKEPTKGRRPLEQVWYTGRIMGEVVAHTITGNRKKYAPGNWFNSAKFFDIEYQNYGNVVSDLPEDQSSFYWENSAQQLAIHFRYNTETREFVGVNTFGIRLRHSEFDKWLNEHKSIEFVMEHLKDANFDPEFYSTYEDEIVTAFNAQEETQIKPKQKSWKRILNTLNIN